MSRICLVGTASLLFAWALNGRAVEFAGERLRRPVALALIENGDKLLVANRDGGTVTLLDTSNLRVLAEIQVGRKLSDMAHHPAGDFLLVTDEGTGELIWVEHRSGSLHEIGRRAVGVSPVSVRISGDGKIATVACLWPRRLCVLDAASPASEEPPAWLDLPFAPRLQIWVPATDKSDAATNTAEKLVLADAFAGKLAVLDVRRRRIDSVRDLDVHNIRGLGLDTDKKGLWLSHQVLHAQGHTTAGDIRTGNLLTNNVRRLSLAALVDPLADILAHDSLYFLGDVERGAGDPGAVAELADGRLLVSLSGVNELAIGQPKQGMWTRLPVGGRPTALAVDAHAQRAYVANMFADSISVVDLRNSKVLTETRVGPPTPLREAERGEMLFFDARLSFEAWFSCHSCHTDGHTSGRLNDNFTDGSFGTPKRVLSLLGVRDTGPWAWNGHIKDLQTQVRTSLTSTMQGPKPEAEQVNDLTAFLQTLAPPPALLHARRLVDSATLQRGRHVFTRQKCALCHTPPTFTSPKTYDVGLRDEIGGKSFNPPSLRGLSQGGPYFHDGRAATLKDVFVRFRHEHAGDLSQQELDDLLYFLRCL
jgi:YVTN family beta-propeller protein